MAKKRVGRGAFYCWHCGEAVEKGKKTCPTCGARYNGTASQKYGPGTGLGAGGIGWSDKAGHPAFKRYTKSYWLAAVVWCGGLSILVPALMLLTDDIEADAEGRRIVKSDPERVKTILNVALQITANTAVAIEPFMPFTAEKMLRMLDMGHIGWGRLGADDIVAAGHKTGTPELLFDKIEDEQIEWQLQKLADSKAANQAAQAVEVAPQGEEVTFEEFGRMDIRVSTILEAEKVAKTKKLLKLTIDTGIDRRVIVSGIAEFFTPEELIGRQVLVLVNLAPRELKGIVSQGMILMGEDLATGRLALLTPDGKVTSGTKIS